MAKELSLETYCDLVVRMRAPTLDDADCARIAAGLGVAPPDWVAAQQLWTARLTDPVQSARWSRTYLDEYQAALRRMNAPSAAGGGAHGSAGDDQQIG